MMLEESVKELQRKRHSATPGVSFRGRVRKVAKWQSASDAESEESESKLIKMLHISYSMHCAYFIVHTLYFV